MFDQIPSWNFSSLARQHIKQLDHIICNRFFSVKTFS